MSQVDTIERGVADIGQLVHENYVNEVLPWLDHISPMAAIFSSIGDKGYSLVGEKLVGSAEASYSGGFMGTDGFLPDHQYVDPIRWETVPARLYVRRAVDNFLEARGQVPGAFEDFGDRITAQMFEAIDRGTTFHIHGSSSATVCEVQTRTSATVLVVRNGYGRAGTNPLMFVEPGMVMALLDASAAFAVLGSAVVSAVDFAANTITFASSIEGAGTAAATDVLVFATTPDPTARHFVTERGRAPHGLLNIIDPGEAQAAFLNVTEATTPRWKPVRKASSNFGHIEIMEFLEEISAASNSEVSAQTHIITMQNGVKIELAKDLLPYQQQQNLGRTLEGGWETVRIGEHDCVTDHYHVPTDVYAICPEDAVVASLDGEPNIYAGDGNQFQRLADYDGREWYARHYLQRWPIRRNRMGALTGVPNPNANRYAAVPR